MNNTKSIETNVSEEVALELTFRWWSGLLTVRGVGRWEKGHEQSGAILDLWACHVSKVPGRKWGWKSKTNQRVLNVRHGFFFSIFFLVHGRYLHRIRLFIIMNQGSWQTHHWSVSCCCLIAKTCATLWDTMDYTPWGSSIHGILQARILEGSTIPFSRGSS